METARYVYWQEYKSCLSQVNELFIYPSFYRKLKRGPQVILPKDIGILMAYLGIGKEDTGMEAGTGSGWLTVSLARVCKKVYSYDLRDDFLKIGMHNAKSLGLENVEFKQGDVTKKIMEKELDFAILDMPGSDKALSNVKKALAEGGRVAGYLPHMEQVKAFVKKLESLKFTDIYTVEVQVRDMLVRKEGVRPSTKGIWHTAYLVFAKKQRKQPQV